VSTRTSKAARWKDLEQTMSAVSVAEQRAWSALQRLEQALGGGRPAGGAEEQAVLERDCELLRQECDSLRRELESVQQRRERAADVVAQVEGRLEGAIDQLGKLAGD
jgi:chromosome segregation ATPase